MSPTAVESAKTLTAPVVVVVGAGMAGLVAALSAQELGGRVTLLEAGEDVGGSAAMAGGSLRTFRSFEEFRRLNPLGEPEQARLVAETYDAAVDWLCGLGVKLKPNACIWPGRTITEQCCGADSIYSPHYRISDPRAMVRRLGDVFRQRGGQLLTRTRAVRLLSDPVGRLSGVVATGASGQLGIAAPAMVLASGGFQGNVELTTRYMGRWADRMPIRSSPWSVGDGLLMGLELGAATSRGLQAFYGHLLPAPPAVITPDNFLSTTARYSVFSVLVNLWGERFADESLSDDLNAQAALRQEQATVFAIFDAEVDHERVSADPSGMDRLAHARAAGGRVATSDTLQELIDAVSAWGVRKKALEETLHNYSQAMDVGTDHGLRVPRARHRIPVRLPPFHAVALAPAITFTLGGLKINGNCQVLDRGGRPIPGLYAAGADVGGTYVEAYGGGLAMALTLGRAAGQQAAKAAQAG